VYFRSKHNGMGLDLKGICRDDTETVKHLAKKKTTQTDSRDIILWWLLLYIYFYLIHIMIIH
jgi:hypothetical protein